MQVLAVRITKPHIPDIIRVNYEKVEELKTALLVEEQHSVRGTTSPIAHDSPRGVLLSCGSTPHCPLHPTCSCVVTAVVGATPC